MADRILILGPTGLIGRRLVPLLHARAAKLRTASRNTQSDVAFDWNADRDDEAILEDIDVIYLVPPSLVADPTARVASFLETAIKVGVAKVVAVSSLGVTFPTEPPESPRHMYESVVMASGLDWTILRPSGFMQNLSEGFMLPGIRQGVIAAAAGGGGVSLVDAGDIAAVAVEALTGGGHIGARYAVTGPEPISFGEVAKIIARESGRQVEYRSITEDEQREAMIAARVPVAYAEILLHDQRAIREGYAAAIAPTVQKMLGRAPRDFADFARETAGVWR